MYLKTTRLKRYLWMFMLTILLAVGFNCVEVKAAEEIEKTEADINIFPDKYNAGARKSADGFTVVEAETVFKMHNTNGTLFSIPLKGNETVQCINLAYASKDIEGTFVFENMDFSKNIISFRMYGEEYRLKSKKKVKFVFNDCKFKSFSTAREENKYVSYEFNNCSFHSFSGSNAKFSRCYFGGGINDRMVPFCCVSVEDCYFANSASTLKSDGEIHVDGVQIYAWKSTPAYDIHFDNCRFEMPILQYINAAKASVNACIMLQLEYNDGYDISFTNCYVNGGGYAIYAHSKNEQLKLEDTVFKNITFGSAGKYGRLYSHVSENVELNEDTWKDAKLINVGTVYRSKSGNATRFSVTNDTTKKRSFVVYSSDGKSYEFTIAASPTPNKKAKEKPFKNISFEDFPFDQMYEIPYCDWFVCYDITDGKYHQVRYVNWTKKVLELVTSSKGKKIVREQQFSISEHSTKVSAKAPESKSKDVKTDKDSKKISQKGEKEKKKKKIYKVKSVTLKKKAVDYTGKMIKPLVVVKNSDGKVVSKKYYSLSYKKNRSIGYGIVTVKMKGEYKGTFKRKFVIRPKGTSITKLSRRRNRIVVHWKASKHQKYISGYQIQYSKSKKFDKKTTKYCKSKSKRNRYKSIKKLKNKTTYYVRIRTYKTIKYEGKKKNIYSSWSKMKKIKL